MQYASPLAIAVLFTSITIASGTESYRGPGSFVKFITRKAPLGKGAASPCLPAVDPVLVLMTGSQC